MHALDRGRERGDLTEVYKWMKSFNKGDFNEALVARQPGRAMSEV